jgi:hypothetical protein
MAHRSGVLVEERRKGHHGSHVVVVGSRPVVVHGHRDVVGSDGCGSRRGGDCSHVAVGRDDRSSRLLEARSHDAWGNAIGSAR